MDVVEVLVTHHMICPCGRTILPMTEEQKAQYYEAVSKRCETKGGEEHKHTVETLPMIECATNDTNLENNHDDKMEIRTI